MMADMQAHRRPRVTTRARTSRSNVVELSYSQVKRFADALEKLVREHGSRDRAAQAMGLSSRNSVNRVLMRRAATRLDREIFETMAKGLHINVTDWDVQDTR